MAANWQDITDLSVYGKTTETAQEILADRPCIRLLALRLLDRTLSLRDSVTAKAEHFGRRVCVPMGQNSTSPRQVSKCFSGIDLCVEVIATK